MNTLIRTTAASALALAAAATAVGPVAAQDYGYQYRPTDEYVQRQRDYEAQRSQYEAQRDDYRVNRASYEAARATYERRRADWEAARVAYDARYGYGSYVRIYGPAPVWDETRWSYWSAPAAAYPAPAAGYVYAAPSAGYYGRNTSYTAPIRCNNNNSAVTAGIIGAIAGGVLGSNVAARNARTEGAVLGALVGGGIGAAVGSANDKYKCDNRGAYYSYRDTIPYRVSNNVYRDDRYSYYRRRGCRLAPAPVNDRDYAYIRVCPDADGRYRITG
jgi:hypothetical protein